MLRFAWIMIIIVISILQTPVYADNAFELTIQVFYDEGYDQNVYYAPRNNTIKIKGHGYAKPFKVVLKNVTSSTQPLNFDESSGGIDMITFEITDESGNTNVVTKKIDAEASRYQGYTYINPGQAKEFEILLTEREWDNAYKLVKQGAAKLKARASYKNGSNIIYSDYYTIILEE